MVVSCGSKSRCLYPRTYGVEYTIRDNKGKILRSRYVDQQFNPNIDFSRLNLSCPSGEVLKGVTISMTPYCIPIEDLVYVNEKDKVLGETVQVEPLDCSKGADSDSPRIVSKVSNDGSVECKEMSL